MNVGIRRRPGQNGVGGLLLCGLAIWLAVAPVKTLAQQETAQVKITPAAEATPPLRFVFWPPPNRQVERDASAMFLRASLMLEQSARTELLTREQNEAWLSGEWQPDQENDIREFVNRHRVVSEELERMTDRMAVHFSSVPEDMATMEILGFLLPEIQRSRDLARLLALRARLEIHDGRWDAFARTMQSLFRLSNVVSEANDFVVSQLVAIAIAELAMKRIEEAAAVPGAPNFYWALASLPPELFQVRRSMNYEVSSLQRVVPEINHLSDEILGADKSRQLLREYSQAITTIIESSGADPSGEVLRGQALLANLAVGVSMVSLADEARGHLRKDEAWAERVDQLSDAEVVLRFIARQLQSIGDNYLKWYWLPDSIRGNYVDRSQRMFDGLTVGDKLKPANMLAQYLLPSLFAFDAASHRIRRTRARLATVEAMRMHAEQHGVLPGSLSAMDIPAWPDPVTGADFSYTRSTPNRAVLKQDKFRNTLNTFEIELIK